MEGGERSHSPLLCQSCDYSKIHISVFLSLCPLSRHVFCPQWSLIPCRLFILIFRSDLYSLSLSLTTLCPSSLLSLTHPLCIIQAEIPAWRAWPLKIHGDAAPSPFSAAFPRRRSTIGWGSEASKEREREEELEENEAFPVEELSQGTRNLWRDLKEIKFRGKFF